MYDLIGDIHGFASVLKRLLRKLGYRGDSRWVQDLDAKIWLVGCFACRKVLIERRRLYEQLIRHN